MVDNAFYLVSEAIAQRSGVIDDRYRIADGRFVLDTKDLSRIRLTSEEYVTGLAGVEQIDKQEVMILIKDNRCQMGTIKPIVEEPQVEEAQVIEETPMNEEGNDNDEQQNNEEENTPSEEIEEEVGEAEEETPINEEEEAAQEEETEEQEEQEQVEEN